MNKKKKKQNGFTIVELVIVIAVIGILAAVLIPTFSNLVKKAKESADQQLVYHINVAAAANEVDNGKAPTMYDTLQALENDYGFTIEKMTPRSGCDIVWDSVTNRFALVENGTTIKYGDPNKPSNMAKNKAQMWKITKAGESLADGYSHYLTADWEGEVPTVSTGLDVGENDDITAVTYARTGDAQDVVIRTNGGELTVNAKNDNVTHYGYADSVNVVDVATASYHENGTVKFLEVTAGHIVLEKESDVSAVHFTATNGEFKNADNKTISIDLSKVNTDDISFSRDAVTIAENGTYVAEVTTDGTEYIWLFGNGIKEQMVATTTAGAIAENGTLKTGITAGAEDGSVAEQIANPAKRNAEGQLVAADGETVVTAENAVVEEVASKESVQIGATLFAGGTGTESDPFLIVDYDTFQHVSDLYEEGYYYFKVKDGVTSISLFNNEYVYLNGSLDGNNVVFTHVNGGMFKIVGTCDEHDTTPVNLSNFTVSNEGGWGITMNCGAKVLNFINVSVTGYSLHNWNAGEFVRYGTGNVSEEGFDFTVNFIKCSCNAEIYSTQNSWSTILVGHTCLGGAKKGTINVDTYTDEHINDSVLYYTGTGTSEGHKYYGMGGVEVFVEGVAKNANENKAVTNIVRVDSTKNPTKAGSGYSITTQADTTKVVVTLLWQYTEWTNNYGEKIAAQSGVGGTIGKTLTFEVTGSTDLKVFDTITSVEIRTSSDKWDYELKDGKLILYMTNTNPYIDGNVTLFVEQFTSGSNIAKYKGSLSLATKTTSSEWVIK